MWRERTLNPGPVCLPWPGLAWPALSPGFHAVCAWPGFAFVRLFLLAPRRPELLRRDCYHRHHHLPPPASLALSRAAIIATELIPPPPPLLCRHHHHPLDCTRRCL
ncbi:hypothetical protein ElyMa_004869900 [Elysia marginata]|uniref:Secreted protein n=1 Tax=Elysia marginata TaxID=1093978 RepID=A0AAV4IQR2_9GAST|nr:hypothetical protein ElyMa_004869900 [Elysia marginata]